MQPLLFLDFDDVICLNDPYGGYDVAARDPPPDLWTRLFNRSCTRRLLRIIKEAQPRVIITTSWLLFMERPGFEQLFAQTGLSPVADALDEAWEAPARRGDTRLVAINRWLAAHHQGEPYAVLDDHLSGTDLAASDHDLADRVALCEPNVGLQEEQLALVLKALGTPFGITRCPRI